jgi:hypothetical protein
MIGAALVAAVLAVAGSAATGPFALAASVSDVVNPGAYPPAPIYPPWASAESPGEVSCSPNGTCNDPCWVLNVATGGFVAHPDSQRCLDGWVKAYDSARRAEGVGPLVLPTNWLSLTDPEKLFVLAGLERTARGLSAPIGLTVSMDSAAQEAAERQSTRRAGYFAGASSGTALGAVYGWMYEEDLIPDCTAYSSPGFCWSGRNGILLEHLTPSGWTQETADQSTAYAGAGYAPGSPSNTFTLGLAATEVTIPGYVGPTGLPYWDMYASEMGHDPTHVVFSWSQEVPYLPTCEQGLGDTCEALVPEVQGDQITNVPEADVTNGGGTGTSSGQPTTTTPPPSPSPSPVPSPAPVSPAPSCDATLGSGVVGMAVDPKGGYWIADSDGQVVACGGASFHGDAVGETSGSPVVGIAADPNGGGYWLTSANGGVFSFGNAPFLGSVPGVLGELAEHLDKPVVGMAADPSGSGYWLVAADGGVFSFGSAPFQGSVPGVLGELAEHLAAPVVGMGADPSGNGYWAVGADGGIFSFGVPFEGSAA